MKSKDGDLALAAVAAYNVLYIDTAEIVATLADVAVSGADVPARQRALQCLRNRQGQSRGVVETIRPLTKSPDALIADDAKTAIEWIDRGGAGSPGPIKGGVAAAAPAPAPASPRGAAVKTSAAPATEGAKGSEERGLAALRERKLAFDEPSFYRALSEADTEAIRAYLDGGMSVNLDFVDSNRRTPLMIVFFVTSTSRSRSFLMMTSFSWRGSRSRTISRSRTTRSGPVPTVTPTGPTPTPISSAAAGAQSAADAISKTAIRFMSFLL